MSKKYTLDLNKVKDLPACAGHYVSDDSYCAVGKIIKGCGLSVPYSRYDYLVISPETNQFVKDIGNALEGAKEVAWIKIVSSINDQKEGDFQENHSKALDKAIGLMLASNIVEVVGIQEEVKACQKVSV